MSDEYDIIIIGSGAGGGTLARHLAPSGKRILLLERGDWLPREPHNWSAQDVFVDVPGVGRDVAAVQLGRPAHEVVDLRLGRQGQGVPCTPTT